MPRFALLEHRRDGVHYDFLLETAPGGPLRAWAVDAEVVPGEDLPARELAEHRALYLEYEGEISGGRGTVRRLDGGEFETLEWGEDRVRVRIAGAQLVGEVEVRRVAFGEAGPNPAWVFRLGNLD